MKETPILFSTPMVQAILNGTKTQTRRVCKYDVVRIVYNNRHSIITKDKDGKHGLRPINGPSCPYGIIGNMLWVKETYYALGQWKKNGLSKTGKQKWKFIDSGKVWFYENHKPTTIRKNSYRKLGWYKRPSLFMPKAAARLWLQITGIRVERLQTITEADAKAEGVEWSARQGYVNYISNHPSDICKYAASSFTSLWLKINGRESWDANPYVWVIEFKVISKTGKP